VKIVDPKVIDAIERRGFRRNPTDRSDTRWIDEHGHMLSEFQLLDETPESVDELIDWFHRT
jgi:hypothetical protein